MARARRRVFISAAATESEWARRLSEQLRAAGVDAWAPNDLLPGDNFSEEVGRALDRAEALVVLVSPAAMKSGWVRQEIQHALGTERFQDRLIPVLVEATPDNDIPWILRNLEWAKGSPARVAEQIVKLLDLSKTRGASAQSR